MKDNTFTQRIAGKKSVLFSAPHSKTHRRPSLCMGYKQAEPYTDYIVERLSKETDGYGIFSTKELEYDPNYQKEKRNEYKKEVRQIVTVNKIKYFFDIHGILNSDGYDVAIFYPTKFYNSKHMAEILAKEIGTGKLTGLNVAVYRFPSNGAETVSEFVASKLRVPAVQVEIAKYIRDEEYLLDTFLRNFSDSINKRFI